jgi:hypothetical protein
MSFPAPTYASVVRNGLHTTPQNLSVPPHTSFGSAASLNLSVATLGAENAPRSDFYSTFVYPSATSGFHASGTGDDSSFSDATGSFGHSSHVYQPTPITGLDTSGIGGNSLSSGATNTFSALTSPTGMSTFDNLNLYDNDSPVGTEVSATTSPLHSVDATAASSSFHTFPAGGLTSSSPSNLAPSFHTFNVTSGTPENTASPEDPFATSDVVPDSKKSKGKGKGKGKKGKKDKKKESKQDNGGLLHN